MQFVFNFIKEKMKKAYLLFGIIFVLFLTASVVAETISISEDVEELIKDVAETKGIERASIEEVTEVDFGDLPAEINIDNIDENSLSLYKVNISTDEKPLYIISFSESKFKKIVSKFSNKMLLNFGFSGEISNSSYLKSATGVLGNLEKGYVMMRTGSVTGLSTNFEVVQGTGTIEVLIYKNKELVGFRNDFYIEKDGIYNDYDTISEETLNFEAGDVISLYFKIEGNIVAQDVNTLLEIATNN